MSSNFNPGDRVIATEALGRGVGKGTKGVVTHESTFHGLLAVRFENGSEIQAVKLHQVEHA
ncbi:hypothetical protein ABZ769_11040 [Streptomyces olivoreticuli]